MGETPKKSISGKLVIAVLLIVIVIAAGVGGYYYFSGLKPKLKVPNPDTFIYQTIGDPDSLDPAWDYESAGGEVLELVYERLVYYDKDKLTIVPELAESWEVSSDGLVYTFHIRKGIKFHDGTPLNASAVKFSLDRVILMNDPDGPAWILAQIIKGGPEYMEANTWQNENETEMKEYVKKYLAAEGIKVIDDYTVQITLEYPSAAFLSMLCYGGPGAIVSPSFVLAHSEKGWWSDPKEFPPFGLDKPGFHNEYMNTHTCGTGAYKVVEWTPKTRIVLEANENYWREPPKIKRVIFQQVTEAGTRLLALFSGEADSVYVPAPNLFDIIEKNAWLNERKIIPLKKGIVVEVYDSLAIGGFEINLNPPDPILKRALTNKNFRYGLSYIFDYDTYINTVAYGLAEQGRGPIPKGLLGYDETLFQFKYNPEKAKECFLKAKAEGAYEDGLKITLYYNAGNEARRRACLLFKDGIEKLNVGILIEVQELDWPTYLAKMRAQELPIFFIGWQPDYADPDNYVATYAHSKMGVFAKRIGYANETIDALVEQAAREQDPNKRVELYREIQRELIEEAVYIWVSQAKTLHVARDWVKGYFYNPMWSGSDTGCMRFMWKEETTEQIAVNIYGFTQSSLMFAKVLIPVITIKEELI
ncbi:MAG: ABC transporter substrate-binding protein [Candidatus Bathyarchaeia archaeon]